MISVFLQTFPCSNNHALFTTCFHDAKVQRIFEVCKYFSNFCTNNVLIKTSKIDHVNSFQNRLIIQFLLLYQEKLFS